MVYKSGQIFLPFCHNTRVWQTDRQTDGQTEFSSLDCVCIPCSAVKMKKLSKRGAWLRSDDLLFKFWDASNISGTAEDTNLKFCMRIYVKGY